MEGSTNERTNERTNIRTERRKLYTPRHKCRGYNEGARVFTALYIDFSRHARAGYSVVSDRIRLKFELIQALMNGLEWSQHFFLYKSMEIFPDAQGQLTLQSLVRSGPTSNLF